MFGKHGIAKRAGCRPSFYIVRTWWWHASERTDEHVSKKLSGRPGAANLHIFIALTNPL